MYKSANARLPTRLSAAARHAKSHSPVPVGFAFTSPALFARSRTKSTGKFDGFLDLRSVWTSVVCGPVSHLLSINDEFTASIVLARSFEIQAGALRWQIRFDTGLAPDVTIAVRLDRANERSLDFYIPPSIDMNASRIRIPENNALSLMLTDSNRSVFSIQWEPKPHFRTQHEQIQDERPETGKENPDRPNTLSESSGAKSPQLSRNRTKRR
jgi:hypothetical protein